jgi:hypothetical protein
MCSFWDRLRVFGGCANDSCLAHSCLDCHPVSCAPCSPHPLTSCSRCARARTQTAWRAYAARSWLSRLQRATLTVQMGWRRHLFNRRVAERVLEREKRELAERIRQNKFDTLRTQYGWVTLLVPPTSDPGTVCPARNHCDCCVWVDMPSLSLVDQMTGALCSGVHVWSTPAIHHAEHVAL